jgi:Conjugative transposon protein TcpC
MATGHQVVPGAPASAEDAAAGPPVTAENATRPVWPEAAWPVGYPGSAGSAGSSGPAGYQVPSEERVEREGGTKPPRLWRGSGGRWLTWVFRIVLWAVLLLIGYRGVAAIVMGYPGPGGTSTSPPAASGGQAGQFPAALAQAYALQFGQVYLNFSQANATQRSRGLAAFLPPGSDPMFGWNGAGTRTLQSEQVAGIRVLTTHRAVVTLLARVNGGLIELGVPIYTNHGRMVVSGYPALLPAPAQAAPPREANARFDPAAGRTLRLLLPTFFRAYAGDHAVRRGASTAAATSLPGLGGTVKFAGISRLRVSAAAGDTRHLTVTVVWQVGARPATYQTTGPAPAELSMSYAMTVVRHRASWLVRSISASAIQPWPAP